MSDTYTTLNPGLGGDSIDEESITYETSPTTRKRSRVVIAGTTQAAIAPVQNTTPSSTSYGLVTRDVEAASNETVILLRRICKLLESSATIDTYQRQRIVAENPTAANLTCTASIAASQTLAALTSLNQLASCDVRYQMMDLAHAAYGTALRPNLVWS